MIDRLIALLKKDRVLVNEKLDKHTTFKVGGPCKALLMVETIEELQAVIKLLKESKEKYFIIGNGSNLLVSDNGYDGYVIKLSGSFNDVSVCEEEITAGAGAMLSFVNKVALENTLSGMEFSFGIPGTVGGAMVMNAGAYGGEMKDVVTSVTLLNSNGEVVTYLVDSMNFGYRDSVIKHEELTVLSVTFKLIKDKGESINEKMQDFLNRRRTKQPLEYPSAGSTFKRPEGAFAGKLIEDSGLSGRRVGGASVSTKHCGFVVNDQNGTASDIKKLTDEVRDIVLEKTGFTLELEVIKIGDFS